ncbi:hypothetical protein [Paraburkholderia dinghuensis]|uniref:Uncharacterized protein n=1 Tax=Paraburkholderia dinghuensis TaxID=2305225 RepID=A0A3N6MFI6_9BURK|nr:hypothetical protein [Paraburkholderia dinghuensis]RQH02719.1 hypothetical protein D1Y85_21540 [Paraburkholderia dinghuensis]
MTVSIDISGVVAALALLLSGYATFKTIQFNRKQEELIKGQADLTALLIEKERTDAVVDRRAELGATFVKQGTRDTYLRIFNQGRAPARNVRIDFPSGNDLVLESDVESKFPLVELDRFQSVQLIAVVHLQSPRKQIVRLRWDDDYATDNEKTLHPTL